MTMNSETMPSAAKQISWRSRVRVFFDLFKLRIGLVIGFTAVAGAAVTPGPATSAWDILLLMLAVTMASAAAGAYNQYAERDLDVLMKRTRRRAFATGRLRAGPGWLAAIIAIGVAGVVLAAVAFNAMAALYTFLGAFTYGVVYTVWLKRRTWWNIVVGGLAGSFAVLAGAAAVTPDSLGALPLTFAVVLFLWTPPTSGAWRSRIARITRPRAYRCCRSWSVTGAQPAPCTRARCCWSPPRWCRCCSAWVGCTSSPPWAAAATCSSPARAWPALRTAGPR